MYSDYALYHVYNFRFRVYLIVNAKITNKLSIDRLLRKIHLELDSEINEIP